MPQVCGRQIINDVRKENVCDTISSHQSKKPARIERAFYPFEIVSLSRKPTANSQKPLVSRHRLANFFTLLCGAISIRRSNCSCNCAKRNKPAFIRSRRLLFQYNFPIELRHACIIGRIILDLVAFSFSVARTLLLFASRLGNAQLVEIMLHFVCNDLFSQVESVLFVFHLYLLAAREDLMTPMLFVPLRQRGSHMHLLNNVPPAYARVVSAETDLAFLCGVRNNALFRPPEVVVEKILEPHACDKQEIPSILSPLHHIVNRAIRTNLAIILACSIEVLIELPQ